MTKDSAPPALHLLSGWAYPVDSLEALRGALQPFFDTTIHPFHANASAIATDRPYILAGWSLGALQALSYMRDAQVPPAGLVLISGTARFCRTGEYPHGMDEKRLKSMIVGIRRNTRATLRSFFTASLTEHAAEQFVDARIRSAEKAFTTEQLAEGLQQLHRLDLRDCLGKINVPTLILHGARDAVISADSAEYLKAMIPDANVQMHPDAGHEVPLQQPDWTANHIVQSLLES